MSTPSPIERLDSFPYRHRVAEVMSGPLLTAPVGLTLGEACDRMQAAQASSLVVVDVARRPVGMLTERDLVAALAHHKRGAVDCLVGQTMSRPVVTISQRAFLYAAIARMTRLNLRHLVAVDDDGRAVGVVTGRALLAFRSREAMLLGDSIASAASAAELAAAKAALPQLARHLLDEDVAAPAIAGVIAGVIRDVTARAAELAAHAMSEDGWGAAPAPWCLLVLGSAGRGETLLGGDQDNALVHAGDADEAPWFAEVGRRINVLLAAAGLPLCPGGVMAGRPEWRRSLASWKAEIGRWVALPVNEAILSLDIFFDFAPVYGDIALARDLRDSAIATAAASPLFLQRLAGQVADAASPLGVFGNFVTQGGRISIKQFGLLPLVGAARVLALKHRIENTATAERIAALAAAGVIVQADAADLIEDLAMFQAVLLDQQLIDLAAGASAGSKIDPQRLRRPAQARLKIGFRRLAVIKSLVGHAMAR